MHVYKRDPAYDPKPIHGEGFSYTPSVLMEDFDYSQVAIHGRVRFQYSGRRDWKSRVYVNPTWEQVCRAGDRALRMTGGRGFLEHVLVTNDDACCCDCDSPEDCVCGCTGTEPLTAELSFGT